MNEQQLINNIKNGLDVNKSLDALYDMHSKIYYKVVHQYFPSSSNTDKKNELISECKYHIFFAAKEFDPSKNTKFSSYLGNKARWLCLGFFNSQKRQKKFDEQKKQGCEESVSLILDLVKKEAFSQLMKEINFNKDNRVSKIFDMRYFSGHSNKLTSWKTISKELSMSVQGCINIHNNFLKRLKGKINK